MDIKEKREAFKTFLKKKKYNDSTPDWLIKLVKEAFDAGISIGEKK